jgi:fructose-bisphosphate aldolase class II
MALVSMRQLLDHAAENNYGIPAFNVNNLEQVQAVMAAADEVGAPVILQASAGARKYAGEAFIKHLIQAAVEMYPHIPLVMHQDHGTSPKVCQGAIDLGFGSVMMDGSLMEDGKTPASFDYNVEVTRKVVEMAHKVGVTVEGELGCLGNLETGEAGEEDGIGADCKLDHSQMLTDPEEAAVFVKATQLDALAIAIGTSHGAYKFSRKPTGDILAISRVKEIHQRIPNTHLVMHGSSSVPARPAGHHQPVRRQDEGNLRRARRGDPGSHQARRAQDQHRHRHPSGHDRCCAQVPVRKPRQV